VRLARDPRDYDRDTNQPVEPHGRAQVVVTDAIDREVMGEGFSEGVQAMGIVING
jgi:hypothetical protein